MVLYSKGCAIVTKLTIGGASNETFTSVGWLIGPLRCVMGLCQLS